MNPLRKNYSVCVLMESLKRNPGLFSLLVHETQSRNIRVKGAYNTVIFPILFFHFICKFYLTLFFFPRHSCHGGLLLLSGLPRKILERDKKWQKGSTETDVENEMVVWVDQLTRRLLFKPPFSPDFGVTKRMEGI